MANERGALTAQNLGRCARSSAWAICAALIGSQALAATPPGGGARIAMSLDAPSHRLEPAGAAQMILRVTNTGSSQTGAAIVFGSPQGLSDLTWTCHSSAGASCARTSGQGDIDESLNGLIAGGALEFRLAAAVAAAPPPFVRLQAHARLPAGAACANDSTAPCRSELSVPTGPNVRLKVEATTPSAAPGQQVRYAIDLRPESSASSNAGTVLRSPVPKGLVDASWTCQSPVGACALASGRDGIEQVLGDFSGGHVRFEVKATVAANAPGTIVAAAAATPPYGGSCAADAPALAAAHAAPCTARAGMATSARVFASLSSTYSKDGVAFAQRFVLENRGTSANGSRVTLNAPAGISGLSWTCQGTGATCPQSSGSGPIEHTVSNWPAQGILRYDVNALRSSAQVDSGLRMAVAPPTSGTCGASEREPPCAADKAMPLQSGFLRLRQQVDRLGASADEAVTYTIVAANDSTDALVRDLVIDVPVPQGIAAFESWTCAAEGAATCPQASGSGAVHHLLAQFPPSSRLVYVIKARVNPTAPGTIVSEARLTAPADAALGCRSASGSIDACLARTELSTVPILALEQSAFSGSLQAGGTASYAFEVVNFGADATDVRINDTVPIGLSAATWACVGLNIGCPAAAGNGTVATTVAQMPAGSGLRYQVSGRVAENPPAAVSNILRAQPGSKGRCHHSGSDPLSTAPCVERSETHARPMLEWTQTSLEPQLIRGGVANYQVSLKNLGSAASGTVFDLPIPEGVEQFDWTCSGRGGAVCPTVSDSGAIHASIAQLPAQGALDYFIRAKLDQQSRSSLLSTLSVTPPAGGSCADDRCDGSLELPVTAVPAAHLDVRIDAPRAWAPPGSSPKWTIDVRNLGAETATDVTIETLPGEAGLTIAGWTCAGVECPAAEGDGAIRQVVRKLAVFEESDSDAETAPGRLVYTVTGQLAAAPGPRASLGVKLSPSAGDTCAPVSCETRSELPTDARGMSEVSIDLQSDEFEAAPNSVIRYVLSISNTGSVELTDVVVSTLVPPQIASQTWTCSPFFSEANCPPDGSGPINEVITFIPVEDGLTFTIDALTGPDVQPQVDYFATVDAGDVFCNPKDCQAVLSLPGSALLDLTLDADVAEVAPDSTVRYTYRIENNGSSSVFGVNVFTNEPPEFLSSTWTCVPEGKTFCQPSGTGPVVDNLFLSFGDAVTYTIDAQVGSELPSIIRFEGGVEAGQQGTHGPGGGLSCNPPSCLVSLDLPGEPPRASITKSADRTQLDPGGTVQYTVVVANTGDQSFSNVELTDPIPSGLESFAWTCSAAGDAFCFQTSGTGALNEFIEVLSPGGTLTYVIDAVVSPDASGAVSNVASLVTEGGVVCDPLSCQAESTLPVQPSQPARVSISKTADRTQLEPGGTVQYTVRVANTGSEPASSLQLVDSIPSGLDSFVWTCSASGDAFCEQTSGSGALNQFIEVLIPGGVLTYTIDAVVSANATGSVTNRALVVAQNVICAPSSCQAVSTVPVGQAPTVSVNKTASPASGTPVAPGQAILWSVIASNSGGPTAAPVVLRDVLPTSVSGISVVADAGVSCNTLAPSPGGTLICTIATGFSGDRGIRISASVAGNASGVIANTASASGTGNPVCVACTVSNPVQEEGIDIALSNPRAYSAGGISGTLFDVVNLASATVAPTRLTVSPASSLRLFAPFAGGCTATVGDDGNISISCPNPPISQGISCSSNVCTLTSLPQGSAATLFVALNPGSAATVSAVAAGDGNTSNNSLTLPAGGTP